MSKESRNNPVTLRLGHVPGDTVDEIRAIAELRGLTMNEELRRIVQLGLAVERKTPVEDK